MAKKEPIPLRGNDGTIRAWACPRCFRVSMSVSCGGPHGREQEAEFSRERAEECGVCRGCGARTDCNRFKLYCDECQRKRDVASAAHIEAHREEWAQQAEQHRNARAAHINDLLKDIPALLAKDWMDYEDLAIDMMPVVLARLQALESPPAADAVDPHADIRESRPRA